jgi:photosystem II stability/assembly factor-like uncharacterized protein
MQGTLFVGATQPASGPNTSHTRGIYRRTAGRNEWERLRNGLPEDMQVNCLVARPDNPRVLYAGSQLGLFRSDDGGDSWKDLGLKTGEMAIYSVLLHPTDAATIYVGMDYAAIFKTVDGGKTWRRLPTVQPAGAIDACFPVRVLRMAADPSKPQEIYAAMEVGGIIRSLDGGETWDDVSQDLLDLSKKPHLKNKILSDSDTEGMMDLHALAISPAQPAKVWAANRMGLFISADRGESWQEFGIRRFSDLSYGRDIMVSPNDPGVFYAALSVSARGDAGSLYRSKDSGETWQRLDHGLKINSTLMTVTVSSKNPDRVYCAARLGQVFGTEDGGKTWESMPLPAGVVDVRAIACT